MAEEFAERMLRTMNEAALALMVSVGHRTGLFDVMAEMPAATSAEIAAKAELDERYVREWLAVMTTGRIVRHDAEAGAYWLPAEHAAWLTRAAGMRNLATGKHSTIWSSTCAISPMYCIPVARFCMPAARASQAACSAGSE